MTLPSFERDAAGMPRALGCGQWPICATLELGGLIELGCEIEEVHFGRGSIGVGNDDKRVDLRGR